MRDDHLQPGWRKIFDFEGRKVFVEVRHYRHRRLPRGHEMARQMMRGSNLAMVEEWSYEWIIHSLNAQPKTIRVEPNGRFSMGGRFGFYKTIEDAAGAYVACKTHSNSKKPQ